MRSWRAAIAGLAAIAICIAADRAQGAPVTWQLSGTVQAVLGCCVPPYTPVSDPALSSLGVGPGAPFTATIAIEPTTADSDTSPDFGRYLGGVVSMQFTAGSYLAVADPPLGSSNLSVNVTEQTMLVSAYGPGSSSLFASPLLGLEVQADAPGTFASDALPIDPPSLASLHPYDALGPTLFGFGTSFVVIGDGTSTQIQIRSAISSWVRVPEPPLALLVVAALGVLLYTSRSRDSAAWLSPR